LISHATITFRCFFFFSSPLIIRLLELLRHGRYAPPSLLLSDVAMMSPRLFSPAYMPALPLPPKMPPHTF